MDDDEIEDANAFNYDSSDDEETESPDFSPDPSKSDLEEEDSSPDPSELDLEVEENSVSPVNSSSQFDEIEDDTNLYEYEESLQSQKSDLTEEEEKSVSPVNSSPVSPEEEAQFRDFSLDPSESDLKEEENGVSPDLLDFIDDDEDEFRDLSQLKSDLTEEEEKSVPASPEYPPRKRRRVPFNVVPCFSNSLAVSGSIKCFSIEELDESNLMYISDEEEEILFGSPETGRMNWYEKSRAKKLVRGALKVQRKRSLQGIL